MTPSFFTTKCLKALEGGLSTGLSPRQATNALKELNKVLNSASSDACRIKIRESFKKELTTSRVRLLWNSQAKVLKFWLVN